MPNARAATRPLAIAIIGGGPRGLSILERLLAYSSGRGRDIRITVLDPHPLGAGRNWSTSRPPHFIMNTLAVDSSLFPRPESNVTTPIIPALSIAEWAAAARDGRIELRGLGVDPAELTELVGRTRPNGFASRRLFGAYLRWAARELVAAADPAVSITHLALEATDVRETSAGGYAIALADGSGFDADAVVLATGHVDSRPEPAHRRLADHAAATGAFYRGPADIADHDLSSLGAGRPVFLNGLGLHFHDIVTQLTEGRGGRFERSGDELRYRASGHEPRIVAGSRRGIPAWSRPEAQPVWDPRATIERLDALPTDRAIDFTDDIWPILDDALRDAVQQTAGRSPSTDHGWYLEPPRDLDFRALGHQLHGLVFDDEAALQSWVRDELLADIAASRNPEASWTKQIAAVTRTIRHWVNLRREFAGFSARSSHADQGGWYDALGTFAGAGAPVSRTEELLALSRADVVSFIGAGPVIEPHDSGFAVRSASLPGTRLFDAVVEARSSPRAMTNTADELISALLARGTARPHLLADAVTTSGALDVDRSLRLIRDSGDTHSALYAVGLPTMGVDFATAVEVVPHGEAFHALAIDQLARTILSRTSPPHPEEETWTSESLITHSSSAEEAVALASARHALSLQRVRESS